MCSDETFVCLSRVLHVSQSIMPYRVASVRFAVMTRVFALFSIKTTYTRRVCGTVAAVRTKHEVLIAGIFNNTANALFQGGDTYTWPGYYF